MKTKAKKYEINIEPAFRAAERLGYKRPDEEFVERTNPYSGVTRTICRDAALLYDFVTTRTATCGRDYTREEWDTARYAFCERWPSEYFDLLD